MQCLTEIFEPNEPISIQMQIFEFKKHLPPMVYLSILNNSKKLLGYHKISQEESLTKMVFNNKEDEELHLCVENQTEIVVSLEMEIKFGHLLNNLEKIPTTEHYQELLDNLDQIELKMETAHSYFV